MATTPCPHCHASVRVPKGETGTCGTCKRPLRFIEVPERPCPCGDVVPVPPGADLLRCSACGRAQAADPRRAVRHVATCPRCRRRIDVPAHEGQTQCPHCQTPLHLQDTL